MKELEPIEYKGYTIRITKFTYANKNYKDDFVWFEGTPSYEYGASKPKHTHYEYQISNSQWFPIDAKSKSEVIRYAKRRIDEREKMLKEGI